MILGCLYKSIITTDIIKPIPGAIPYRNYAQLKNFTLVALPAKDLLVLPRNLEKSNRIKQTTGLSIINESLINSLGLGQYLDLVRFSLQRSDRFEAAWMKTSEVLESYSDILQRVRIFEYEEDALEQIGNCNAKKAFVGSAQEIEDFIKFNRNRVKLGKGRDKFLPHFNFWKIPDYAGGSVHRRMAQLISSGIYHVWEKLFYSKTRAELNISLKKTIETKQSMDTNLGVLFEITGLGLAVSTVVFCIEILILMKRKSMELSNWLNCVY